MPKHVAEKQHFIMVVGATDPTSLLLWRRVWLQSTTKDVEVGFVDPTYTLKKGEKWHAKL
jgi:hypothetical protein